MSWRRYIRTSFMIYWCKDTEEGEKNPKSPKVHDKNFPVEIISPLWNVFFFPLWGKERRKEGFLWTRLWILLMIPPCLRRTGDYIVSSLKIYAFRVKRTSWINNSLGPFWALCSARLNHPFTPWPDKETFSFFLSRSIPFPSLCSSQEQY